MTSTVGQGTLHPLTLRYRDDSLEAQFQTEEGAAGLSGYRIITGATVVLWAIAAFVVPISTTATVGLSLAVSGTMVVVGFLCFTASVWTTTVNRQHALASFLTSANGLMILYLAYESDFVAGYAVAAIMLLFLFGFVSRTRFVFAAIRTGVIAAGLAFVTVLHQGPGSLVFDIFVFAAASAGSLVGLRMIERNRRELWHQSLVVEEQRSALAAEQVQSERLLLNVLPESVSKRLKRGESQIADDFSEATVLFADIVGFTPIAAQLTAAQVIEMLSELFSMFDDLVTERELEKIKTIGDAYMAVGGLPEPLSDHASRVVDLAVGMLAATNNSPHFRDMSLRIGIHSGPVAGGVIGVRKFAYDVWGNTVNMAARLETSGVPGRIHVSEQTVELTGDLFEYELRGETDLRGIGKVRTYLVAM